MAKTPLEKFSDDIAGILEEYADDVRGNLEEIVKGIGKKGAKAVQAQAKATVGGKMYAYSDIGADTIDQYLPVMVYETEMIREGKHQDPEATLEER